MNFKMKTTMFKVFVTCIATLCITLPVPSRASPVLSSMSVKSGKKDKYLIREKPLDKEHEILAGLKFVDLKSLNTELIANEVLRELKIAVHEQMMASREFHRQRRSFDSEVEVRLRKEIVKDDSTLSIPVDSKEATPLMPPKSNEEKNSQQPNENENDDEVHELPDPPNSIEQENSVHESNESDHPRESSEPNNLQESNESNNPRESSEPNNLQESNESNNPRESSEPNNLQESNESNNPRESSEPNNLQESNESNNPQESNEPNNPRESNEPNNPRESNEPNNPRESNEPNNPKESNESTYPPDTKSYEFDTGSENGSDDNNDDEEKVPDEEHKLPFQNKLKAVREQMLGDGIRLLPLNALTTTLAPTIPTTETALTTTAIPTIPTTETAHTTTPITPTSSTTMQPITTNTPQTAKQNKVTCAL